jgi:hypothetical protein
VVSAPISHALAPVSETVAANLQHSVGSTDVPFSQQDLHVSLRDRVVTPYNPAAFQSFIDRFDSLRVKYPFLVRKLSIGFRLGDLRPLTETFTPPNHPSASTYSSAVLNYLKSEVEKGRMSGPFTKTQLEEILGGPFRSSPIQVVAKFDTDGNLTKTRMAINLSFRDGSGVSVNDMIDSDDFPMKWGTASEVEIIVSCFLFSLLFGLCRSISRVRLCVLFSPMPLHGYFLLHLKVALFSFWPLALLQPVSLMCFLLLLRWLPLRLAHRLLHSTLKLLFVPCPFTQSTRLTLW